MKKQIFLLFALFLLVGAGCSSDSALDATETSNVGDGVQNEAKYNDDSATNEIKNKVEESEDNEDTSAGASASVRILE